MVERNTPTPVRFRQAVYAQAPTKTAALESDGAVSERGEVHRARHDVGLDAERAAARLVEPQVDAGKVAGGHRTPGQRRTSCGLLNHSLWIEKVHRRKPRDAIARDRQLALPKRLAAAAAIFGALPEYAHATAEIGGGIGSDRLCHVRTVQHIDPLDRRGADDFGRNPHRHRTRPYDVAHQCLAYRKFLSRSKPWIFRKSGHRLIERSMQIEEDACPGRAVVLSAAQRLKQCIAREFGHEIAGEAADRAEARCARSGSAGATLVIVAVTHDADAKSLLERVVQNPFERAPGRVHLDGTFEPTVMGVFQVRIAPADVGNDNCILAFERAEQFVRRVDRLGRGLTLDQDVR